LQYWTVLQTEKLISHRC